MISADDRIPEYLTEKGNTIKLIVFTAIFALVFINIYSPFGIELLYDLTEIELLLYSSSVVLAGLFIVVISRFIMLRYSRKRTLMIWQYIIWVLAEISVIGFFFLLIQKFVLHNQREIIDLLEGTIRNTALILLLPYVLSWLYFAWKDKSRQLEGLSNESGTDAGMKNMIAFRDEKGVLRISVKLENVVYIEANENYVNIYYLDNEKLTAYMLRNTLKNMEELLGVQDFARCHRKYLVNFNKVKIIRRVKRGLNIELDIPGGKALPVSATYVNNVMKIFSKHCA